MSTPWLIAVLALWALLLANGLALLAVMRQVGVLTLEVRGHASGGSGPPVNAKAPVLAGQDLGSGRQISTRSLARSVTVLAFLSRQCPFCQGLAPALDELAHQSPNVEVIAIIADGREAATGYVEELSLAVPALCEEDTQAFSLYGVQLTPTIVVLDRAGVIVSKGSAHDRQELDRLVFGVSPAADGVLRSGAASLVGGGTQEVF